MTNPIPTRGIPDWAMARMPEEFRRAILAERERRLPEPCQQFNRALRSLRASEDAVGYEALVAECAAAKAAAEACLGRALTPEEDEGGIQLREVPNGGSPEAGREPGEGAGVHGTGGGLGCGGWK